VARTSFFMAALLFPQIWPAEKALTRFEIQA
jgi:hypothetical protein